MKENAPEVGVSPSSPCEFEKEAVVADGLPKVKVEGEEGGKRG